MSTGQREPPLRLGSAERPLFVWLHPPAAPARDCGVVLCSPLGTDATRSERSFRHLAARLAAEGSAVVRFDPYGTGDSAGHERAAGLVETWLRDISGAVEALRSRGARTVSLVGLRLGATLALVAAARAGGVDSMVLWNPTLDGRSWLGESVKLHKLYQRIEPLMAGAPASSEGQEALGLLVTDELAADLARLDALALPGLPARHVLLVDETASAARARLLTGLAALGAEVEHQAHPGQRFLATASHHALLPEGVLDAIVGWLTRHHPLPPAAATAPRSIPPAPPAAILAAPTLAAPVPPAPILAAPVPPAPVPWTIEGERPLRFGPGGELFGILTAPGRRASPAPAIVLVNAGTVNRVGPHRLYVAMARRFAGLGFPVLRIDLSGIGDSPPRGAVENLCYPPGAVEDVEAAIAYVRGAGIADHAVVAGLCSGGDLAFQAALRGPAVVGALLLNPRTFCVHDLQAVEAASGEAPSDSVENVPRALARMAGRGIDTVLLVSEGDPGVRYVDQHFPTDMVALRSLSSFTRIDIRGSDHNFTPVPIQVEVVDRLAAHLLPRLA